MISSPVARRSYPTRRGTPDLPDNSATTSLGTPKGRPFLSLSHICYERLKEEVQRLEHEIYLQFSIQSNSWCHQLHARACKRDAERLVNETKSPRRWLGIRWRALKGDQDILVENTSRVQDSLMAVNGQTEKLAETTGFRDEAIAETDGNSKDGARPTPSTHTRERCHYQMVRYPC